MVIFHCSDNKNHRRAEPFIDAPAQVF